MNTQYIISQQMLYAIIFETKNSDIYSFPYPYLDMVHKNNRSELEVNFMSANIIIKGKNLDPILKAINSCKLTYIRTGNRNDLEQDYQTFIDNIEIKEYDIG